MVAFFRIWALLVAFSVCYLNTLGSPINLLIDKTFNSHQEYTIATSLLAPARGAQYFLHVLAILCRRHTILALEHFPEVGGGESHGFGNGADGGVRFFLHQTDGILHTDAVDIGSKGLAVGVGLEQVVQSVPANVKSVNNVLSIRSNSSLSGLEVSASMRSDSVSMPMLRQSSARAVYNESDA